MRERKNASVPGVLDLVAAPSAPQPPQRHSQRSIHLFRDGNVASRSHGSRHVNQFGTGQLAPVPPSSSARRGNNHFPSQPQSGFPTDFFPRRRGHPKVRLRLERILEIP